MRLEFIIYSNQSNFIIIHMRFILPRYVIIEKLAISETETAIPLCVPLWNFILTLI